MNHYILALDQGTTSSRALIIDRQGQIKAIAQKEFKQIFPKPGWVEHDPEEIWESQWEVILSCLNKANIDFSQIETIGITNQRETTVIWDKTTGKAVYNAIVWQDRRTADICEQLKEKSLSDYVRANTGLVIDSYFSGTKIKWILDHVSGARDLADNERLAFGTIDTWLIWKLTQGKTHVTDQTNASRTMIYNIRKQNWDQKLLSELNIPNGMLPEVKPSVADFGYCTLSKDPIPICGVAGDQQAALFGQACTNPGETKNTYGTGCFMLMNTGSKQIISKTGLVTTLACNWNNQVQYALEGSVFIAGAAIQWIRDGLQIIDHAAQSEAMAREVQEQHEVVMVPAFAGLGAPYWDMYARGAIFGITRDSTSKHIAKAALDSMAFQTRDVLVAMIQDSGLELEILRVDGGATSNNYLMQFQADLLNTIVERPQITESTAMGAAYLAGIRMNWWDIETIQKTRKIDRNFSPTKDNDWRNSLCNQWSKAVKRTIGWSHDED